MLTIKDVCSEKLLVLFGGKRQEIEQLLLVTNPYYKNSNIVPLDDIVVTLGIQSGSIQGGVSRDPARSFAKERYALANRIAQHVYSEFDFEGAGIKRPNSKELSVFLFAFAKELIIPDGLVELNLSDCEKEDVLADYKPLPYFGSRNITPLVKKMAYKCGVTEELMLDKLLVVGIDVLVEISKFSLE